MIFAIPTIEYVIYMDSLNISGLEETNYFLSDVNITKHLHYAATLMVWPDTSNFA